MSKDEFAVGQESMTQNYAVDKNDLILVTGAAGFIGVSVVQRLLEEGFTNLRCFVRPFSQTERLTSVLRRFSVESDVETVRGDLMSREHCRKAARGVSVIYHLAAGFDKSFAGAFMNSALATRNLMDAFLELGEPKRFVNVSSFAVYSTLKLKRGAALDENCPLEDAPQERYDAYAFGKLKQEELVRGYGATRGLPLRDSSTGDRVRAREEGPVGQGWDRHVRVLHSPGWLKSPAANVRRQLRGCDRTGGTGPRGRFGDVQRGR